MILIILIIGIAYILFFLLNRVKFSNSNKLKQLSINKFPNSNKFNEVGKYSTLLNKSTDPLDIIDEDFNNKLKSLENLYELYKINLNGIPNTYRQGNLIQGEEPNVEKAIDYLTQALDLHYEIYDKNDYTLYLELAKIYHNGVHTFQPDLDKAISIYNNILVDNIETTSLNINLKIECERSLEKLQRPLKHPLEIDQNHREIVINQDHQNHQNYQDRQNHIPQQFDFDLDFIDNETVNFNRVLLRNIEENRRLNQIPNIPNIHGNDPQNVHDHAVNDTISKSIENLKKLVPQGSIRLDTTKEIREFLATQPKNDKINNALISLNYIDRNGYNKHSKHNMSEKEALDLVWSRINSFDIPSNQSDLKTNLINELADMNEFGKEIVCSTGRFNRIIDTLNIVDPNVKIIPEGALNQEIMNKCSNIRSNLYKEYTETDKKLLDEGIHANQDKFDEKLKSTIETELRNDYKDILTKPELDKKIVEFSLT